MDKNEKWLEWAVELQIIAQAGLSPAAGRMKIKCRFMSWENSVLYLSIRISEIRRSFRNGSAVIFWALY